MREDFGVGFGRKIAIAVPNQLIFQRLVILDHAVVHERQFPGRVEMRMGVLIGRLSVSGPARVADAESSGRRLFRHEFSERGDASGALAGFDAARHQRSRPRRNRSRDIRGDANHRAEWELPPNVRRNRQCHTCRRERDIKVCWRNGERRRQGSGPAHRRSRN